MSTSRPVVTPWARVIAEAPDLARRVQEVFGAGVNKTLATLRADGSPRISASELEFGDDRVTLGMMPASRKLADVRRDPRVAIHSPTLDPPAEGAWVGDAKLAGVLIEDDRHEPGLPDAAFFELDLSEVVLTHLNDRMDRLVIESWHPGRGYERVERE